MAKKSSTRHLSHRGKVTLLRYFEFDENVDLKLKKVRFYSFQI